MKQVLVLGGGWTAKKRLDQGTLTYYQAPNDRSEIVDTIDLNPDVNPTWLWDLNGTRMSIMPTPWPCNNVGNEHRYDEVHAYEILEHLGRQGDARSFFGTFAEIWYALKPGGYLFAASPSVMSRWAWGDPSHTRIISAESLVFLQRAQYERQLGKTAMSDFRSLLVGDWHLVDCLDDGESFRFVLRAK